MTDFLSQMPSTIALRVREMAAPPAVQTAATPYVATPVGHPADNWPISPPPCLPLQPQPALPGAELHVRVLPLHDLQPEMHVSSSMEISEIFLKRWYHFSNVLYAGLHYVLESWQAGVADIYIKVTYKSLIFLRRTPFKTLDKSILLFNPL